MPAFASVIAQLRATKVHHAHGRGRGGESAIVKHGAACETDTQLRATRESVRESTAAVVAREGQEWKLPVPICRYSAESKGEAPPWGV